MRTTKLLVLVLLLVSPLQAATLILQWSAPGDDGFVGRASKYDLRFSTAPITAANWNQATVVQNVPPPKAAGEREKIELTGFAPNSTYYFALKTADEKNNWSAVSNNAIKKTCAGCSGQTGNVNASLDGFVDLSDLALLISFLLGHGTGSSFCFEEANVNGSIDNRVDLSDLAYLTNYLNRGAAPPNCR